MLRRALLRFAKVRLKPGTSVCGRGWIYGRGVLELGEGTWVSPGATFYTHCDAPIVIGARCDVGPGVEFITGSHTIGDSSRRAGAGTASPIKIGSGCWIGAGARILGGVTIGDGAVIGAGAVVIQDIPENTLAVGVPAVAKKRLP